MGDKLLSVVIPNWNGKKFLETCLDSLLRQTYTNLEIIIVDNASEDGSQLFITENYPDVILIQLPENRGFTGACNAGMETSTGDYICLLNNDTEVDVRWAEAIISAFERHADVGTIACKMLLFDKRDHIHTTGDLFTVDGEAVNRGVWEYDNGQFDREEYVFSACGGSSVYRREMLEQIGYLDDDFFFLLEDMDLGWRSQLAGWRCLYTPHAIVYHHLSATGGGVTASYYAGRNMIILLTKNYPSVLWRKYGWMIVKRQFGKAFDALKSWRGEAARARLRGMFAGVWAILPTLKKRHEVQKMRTVSIEYLESILSPPHQS